MSREFTITRRNGSVYTVLLDAADYETVMAAGPWFVDDAPGYVRRYVRKADGARTPQYLHAFLLPDAVRRDHVNGNRLDNRRANLRAVTNKQNAENMRLRRDNRSGFRGVAFDKVWGKWQAYVGHNGRLRHLGRFATAELAAEAARAERLSLFTHNDGDRAVAP